MKLFWILAVAGMLGAVSPAAAQGTDALIEHGRSLVEANCLRCHAVLAGEDSAHPEAPPLASLSQYYPVDALEESFAEGIVTGHPDMPEFEASPEQIEAILAFLASVQE